MSLEVTHVHKSFGNVKAVHDVSLHVPPGMIYGLIGPNGAGKTTTMRMILTILLPDAGTITWNGQPVTRVASRSFGYLPEERGLYPQMGIRDELRFFAGLHGIRGRAVDQEIDAWIERLELTEHAHKKVEALSKGNAQKVQFLASLLHHPQLLVLDEPFSGLDPVNVRLLKQALLDLAQEGTAILFSTHRMEHVEELCSRLALIRHGEIILEGTVAEVRRSSGRRLLRLGFAAPSFAQDEIAPRVLRGFAELPPPQLTSAGWQVELPAGFDPARVLQAALSAGNITLFEVAAPSIEEVYVELMGGTANHAA
ncbi:MAG: ATP-binding cassette domain-containing protein [Limnochordaceae bacterium]|nr:ATP-binding cassette domain-containing protein [Limnochordaceae bacterium]